MAEKTIRVEAGKHDRKLCPVAVAIPDTLAGSTELLDEKGRRVPHQMVGGTLHFIVSNLKADSTLVLKLKDGSTTKERPGVIVFDDSSQQVVEVRLKSQMITRYHYSAAKPRPFLYPLIGPYGDGVTRNYPMAEVEGEQKDHRHHRSCYVAWGDVNGADNWSEEPGHASIRHQKFLEISNGTVLGRISALNYWLTKDGVKQMEEERTYTFYNVAPERLFDLTVKFTMTEGDIRFGDTKEGGIISFRVATTMDRAHGGLITHSSGGKTERETWGKRSFWCDYSGPVQGKTVGITVMDTPGNFRYPTYWHVRDYGLMTANPFGLSHFLGPGNDGSLVCPRGSQLVFRYRVFIHKDDAAKAAVADRFVDYVFPPQIVVE